MGVLKIFNLLLYLIPSLLITNRLVVEADFLGGSQTRPGRVPPRSRMRIVPVLSFHSASNFLGFVTKGRYWTYLSDTTHIPLLSGRLLIAPH